MIELNEEGRSQQKHAIPASPSHVFLGVINI